jgi:hypothetical protein
MVTILHRVALTSYVLIAAQGAPAGSSGISGTVRDLCGFVTPGATVSAVNRDGIRADTTTDASGRYVLRVGPGTWTLSFELRGFRQQRQDLVITTPDNNIEVNIRLALARPTEMITPHSPRIRYERYAMQGVVRGDDGAGIPQAIIRLRPKRTAQFRGGRRRMHDRQRRRIFHSGLVREADPMATVGGSRELPPLCV